MSRTIFNRLIRWEFIGRTNSPCSNASHARLVVDYQCGYFIFSVEDNGVGTFAPVEGHYGITIMRERAQNIGGDIRVESNEGLGTCVQLYFPEPGSDWRKLHD